MIERDGHVRKHLDELEQIAQQQYPKLVDQLATLLNQPVHLVERALLYTVEQAHQDRFILVNSLLMFHYTLTESNTDCA